ncbi:MAG: hypothetical protein NTW66_04265 [Candidatus Magasanikbacteria bacterium]|nr:hypothetical protein [Candidatus Magasanikbacteria bacterium]
MFDDIPTKNSTPPQNLPTEPVDMFAGVAEDTEGPSALDAGILRKKSAGVQVPPAEMAQGGEPVVYSVKEPVLGKVIGFFIFLVVAAVVGYGGWRLYAYFTQKSATTPSVDANIPAEEQQPITETEEPSEVPLDAESGMTPDTGNESATTSSGTANYQIQFGEPVDTDKDGLDDTKEEEAKTDMNNPDTDADGLTDGDEVIIWKTNPLNPDTDGDSYLDGDEVRHGYNPLGDGKLFNGQNSVTSSNGGSDVTTSTATTTASTSTDENNGNVDL